ncbi:MAG: HdeD family acid-resistance protein [Ignavibacteria bacterium]|nr:HdeD family acid-resistance protein [Ignavibacteria bacterium]
MNENTLVPGISINWKWMVVRGIVSTIFGIIVVIYPFTAAAALALFFGAYIFFDGVFAIVSLFTSRTARAHFWSYLIEGIAGIAIGILAFFLPEITLYGLAILVSVWAFSTGILEIISAIKLRKVIDGEFWMIVSGILSIVFAILIFLWPASGIVVMIYLIGIYALLFGIMMVFMGFSIRNLQPKTSN